jgi:hypothetical protein
MSRKKKESTEEPYFGEREEAAVIEYMSALSYQEKNKIFNTKLKKPFKKMVGSILRKYPTYLGYNDINDVENDGMRHVITQLHLNKFDASNGKKAYSYFGTIVRNYFRTFSKTTRKESLNDLNFDDYLSKFESDVSLSYVIDEEDENTEEQLFNKITLGIKEEIRVNKGLKINEIKVGEAIINIFERWQDLFLNEDGKSTNNFAKNKILLFIKEQTMLSTKEIREALLCYKTLYFLLKKDMIKD